EQGRVFRNLNADTTNTWTSVLSDTGMARASLAIAPSNPQTIYALTADFQSGNFQDGLHAAFRSTDAGGTWSEQVDNASPAILNRLLLSNTPYGAGCAGPAQYFNQGWYDNVIAVDPTDTNRVWAGGIDLFRSDDGGANWGIASYWWANPAAPTYAHADQHAIVFHPAYNGTTNKQMFVGNDGGLFVTNDALAATGTSAAAACSTTGSSVTWANRNNGYGVTQFYYGVPYPGGATFFGGTQDNGTVRGTTGAPNTWATVLGGDGGAVAVDPTNTLVLYAENTGLSIQKSTTGAGPFSSAVSGITESNFLFIAPFVMDPGTGGSSRLWTGGTAVWRTTNGAASWVRASTIPVGAAGQNVSAIAVAPSSGGQSVLVGLTHGETRRTAAGLTANGSTAWGFSQPVSGGYVSGLAFHPTNALIAYATYSTFGVTHVWKTTTGGASWVGIDGVSPNNLPDIPAHSVLVDPFNTNRLYVGTDLGVFVTNDGGTSWAVENTGFANVVTEALAMDGASLFAFTHGRGAWKVATAGAPTISI